MKSFETDRLILRPWNPELDAGDAFAIYGDPEVTRYLGSGKPIENAEAQRAELERIHVRHTESGRIARGFGFWACEEKASGRVLGGVLLLPLRDSEGKEFPEVEIGWHFGRFAWGRGFATEAAKALADYGLRELGLAEIYAVAYPENTRSHRVMERLGMQHYGMTSKYFGLTLVLYRLSAPGKRPSVGG